MWKTEQIVVEMIMALRRILRIDNPEDKKILKGRAREVKFPNLGLKQLIADMFETMEEANGVGLAAPQIGLSQRIVVIQTPPVFEKQDDETEIEVEPSERYVLINPEIVKTSKEDIAWVEGCLSLPGWYGEVDRPNWVTVDYTDVYGKHQRLRKVDGWLGRIVQHELDHLDGVMFTERMRDLSTLREITADEAEAEATPAE